MKRLNKQFYTLGAVEMAQQLLGKTLVRVFDDGTIKHYQQKLTTQLNAGSRTTVNLSMDGVLLEEGDTGEFQIDKWKEQHDSIHISLN